MEVYTDCLGQRFAVIRKLTAEILDSAHFGSSHWTAWPIGTQAPALMGGHWNRVQHGWQWGKNGGTFPRPGGDWPGTLLLPLTKEAQDFAKKVLNLDIGAETDTPSPNSMAHKEN